MKILETFKNKFGQKTHVCQCECGTIVNVPKYQIDIGKRKSCGKGVCNKNRGAKIGDMFGKLTIISYNPIGCKYTCKCECGNTTTNTLSHLKHQKSCNCHSKQVGKRLAKHNKLATGVAILRRIMKNYRWGAKTREHVFELTEQDMLSIIKKPCYYCGVEYSMIWNDTRVFTKEEPYKYNGVDRLDNTKGYTLSNCVPSCKQCNYAKCKLTYDEWKQWSIRLANNIKNF